MLPRRKPLVLYPEKTGAGKAVGEGAPSQKTCPLLHIPNPSWKEDSWYDVF